MIQVNAALLRPLRVADNARVSGTRPPLSPSSRNALIVGAVVLLHASALWSLRASLLSRPPDRIVPVQLLDAVALPPPPLERPAALPMTHPPPARVEPSHRTTALVHPAPAPLRPPAEPVAEPAPAPLAEPDASLRPQSQPPAASNATPIAPAPAAAPAAPAPSPAGPRVEQPISDADYLHNPPPAFPRASERLGEKGLVIVHALIGIDGRAKKAQIAKSSGYPRLDDASIAAVLGWRYVPGKRGGVPEEMWFDVPIRWGS